MPVISGHSPPQELGKVNRKKSWMLIGHLNGSIAARTNDMYVAHISDRVVW